MDKKEAKYILNLHTVIDIRLSAILKIFYSISLLVYLFNIKEFLLYLMKNQSQLFSVYHDIAQTVVFCYALNVVNPFSMWILNIPFAELVYREDICISLS